MYCGMTLLVEECGGSGGRAANFARRETANLNMEHRELRSGGSEYISSRSRT